MTPPQAPGRGHGSAGEVELSVVMPAFNEEANVRVAVERALDALPRCAATWEVIVVDDGSIDGTPDVLDALVEEHHPLVRAIGHDRNLGYGAAIRTGLRHAHGQLLFYTDCDNQFDIGEVEYLVPLMRDHGVAIGFRVYRYDTVLRSVLSWLYNRLAGVIFRLRVRDVDCAFKLMRREVLEHLELDSTDFFIDTEIVARARKWNFDIAQKGVRHYPRFAGETTVLASDIPRTLRTVARMWKRIYFPTKRELNEIRERDVQLAALARERVPERARQ
jgi:glycosyltransferase involved in cell wall biosynthesis